MLNQRVISAYDLMLITGESISQIEVQLGLASPYSEEDVFQLDVTDDTLEKLQRYFDNQPVVIGKQRRDLDGLFWQAEPKTITVKPERVWENDDYIPFLDEVAGWIPNEYTDRELVDCTERLTYDIEVYANYTLIAFEGITSGKLTFFELSEFHPAPNYKKLQYIIDNKELISFNGIGFDSIIMSLFLNQKSCADMQRATTMIIEEEVRGYEVLKAFKTKLSKINQIDIMELCPLQYSLKLYGARLHCDSIIDLPFKPLSTLCEKKISVVKYYCANDLSVTRLVYLDRLSAIELREKMSEEYDIDLRSKSDAQVAEAIIAAEYKKLTGREAEKREFVSFKFKYNVPAYINFKTPELQEILEIVRNADIDTGEGKVMCPDVEGLIVTIGGIKHKMGLGGLHVVEESIAYIANENKRVTDIDAASFYPKMIIDQKLSPESLGFGFLNLYENKIFYPRLEAKKKKDKVKDAMLKICLNGSFGKFGSKYSILYAPRLLAQVTISGQLTILMFMERLQLAGIDVVLSNTDGIVVYCDTDKYDLLQDITKAFERHCNMIMEETHYSAIYNRDVNNYIAIKTNGEVKLKGAYAESSIAKNPVNVICTEAVVAYLTNNIAIADTIKNNSDIRKFITLRNVKGGAVKDGEYLGKTVRYYHSNSTNTAIVYANSGNLVPMSNNCRPLQRLPDSLPQDLDWQWYINEANRILNDIGVKS